ncbi:radical SAM protein [Desulfitobacterium sp.]|uniref:radical SAM protein n=1 Tax=Desulfitobacterium sp. TaxID=49981 RepID=UPI002B202744|nr:radical SAM protein [Desulfitobacterium sp.]MEA4901588.1 radical SAM protein [Desulfitobacterium sp.]
MANVAGVQTSLAAAMTLGLKEGTFYRNAKLRALNLLLTNEKGCSANCSYCGLSRSRVKSETFIRVAWPTYPLQEIIQRSQHVSGQVQRVCVSMITYPRALEDLCKIIRDVKAKTLYPVSALITPTIVHDKGHLELIRECGADRIGIAIDTATKKLFELHRGKGVGGPHSWDKYWKSVGEAIRVFGREKVGIHLVVGLGESEAEMVKTIQRADDLGALTHLFSFFPEKGTQLENKKQPPLGSYRRVQMARYLINHKLSTELRMKYNEHGQIVHFGIDERTKDKIIADGEAFMTSGCPGADGKVACNRPYGNERPSQPIRNFPFPPEASDIADILMQLSEY